MKLVKKFITSSKSYLITVPKFWLRKQIDLNNNPQDLDYTIELGEDLLIVKVPKK